MNELLLFTGALKKDPAINVWLGGKPDHLRRIAREWFERMRQCGGDVRELIHDGCPVVCVKDAPFAYVNVFRDHVNVGFFHGAALDNRDELLEGTGKHMRHVKLRPNRQIDAAALSKLIDEAYVDIKARLEP
jgi:hypothetical protein